MTLFVDGRPITSKALDSFDVDGFEPGVDDVPALRAVGDHSDKDVIFVKSLQDLFYYDDSSVAVDDGATIIQPDDVTGPGRWLIVPGSGIPGAHATTHQSGAGDELDGDLLDIDVAFTNITPDTTPPEVTTAAHLGAILKGIDNALVGAFLPPSFETSASNSVKRTATTYADVPDLTLTPGVGTYLAYSIVEFRRTGGSPLDGYLQFAVNGVAVASSEKQGRMTTNIRPFPLVGKVTVGSAGHAVTVQWRGSDLIELEQLRRQLLLIKVA
jgi:hypothetical protein